MPTHFTQPRTLMLSWRPSTDDFGPNVKKWTDRLRKVLRVQCPNVTVLDPTESTDQGQAVVSKLREDKGVTDFLAVYTADYCLACAEEAVKPGARENELLVVTQLLKRLAPAPPFNHWVARLEASPPWGASVGDEAPWSDPVRPAWHFLPSDAEDDFFDLTNPQIASLTDRRCVEPLKTAAPPQRGAP